MWHPIYGIDVKELTTVPLKYSVSINGYEILIVRKNNVLYAMNMECPHAGKSLLKGKCNEQEEIECPFHSFKFHMKTGACTNSNEGYRLKTFDTKIDNQLLYVFVE